jgi:hypothetical protein
MHSGASLILCGAWPPFASATRQRWLGQDKIPKPNFPVSFAPAPVSLIFLPLTEPLTEPMSRYLCCEHNKHALVDDLWSIFALESPVVVEVVAAEAAAGGSTWRVQPTAAATPTCRHTPGISWHQVYYARTHADRSGRRPLSYSAVTPGYTPPAP